MRIRNILITTIIGTLVMTGQVYADSPQGLPIIELEEAMRSSIANDSELILMKDKIALAEKDLTQVKANAEYLKTKAIFDKDEYVSNRKQYLLTPIKKEHQLASLKRQEDSKSKSLQLDVMSQYFDVMSKIDQVADAKRSVETIEKEIKAKSKELALGKITQLDYNAFEIKKIEADNALKKANIELEISYMRYANSANKPFNYKFKPSATPQEVSQYILDNVDNALKNELLNNHDLLSKKDLIAELELEIKINTDSQYEMGNVDSETTLLQNDLKAAQSDLENIISSIEMNFKIDLQKLKSSYNSILISKSSLELAQKELLVANSKYGVGNISLIDLLAKQKLVDDAESAYNASIATYRTDVKRFKMVHFIQ